MIVVEEPGELLLVTQPDHAGFAAQLLSLWRLPELSEHPRREALLVAVREHDNGWREADAAPRVDPGSGRPYDFRTLADEHRREIWRRGVRRYATEDPYVALLAVRHSWEMHHDRAAPGWAVFLEELDALREELVAAVAIDADELARDYAWLSLADALSLAVCCRARTPVRSGGVTARLHGGELEIEPFPLAGATTFEIPVRRIPNRRYQGEADLAGALGAARWTRLSVRCRAGGGAP